MNLARRVVEVALRLIDLLEGKSTPYALMGGIAIPVWGIPRATYDVDLVLAVDGEGLSAFLSSATEAGFQVEAAFAFEFRDVLAGME